MANAASTTSFRSNNFALVREEGVDQSSPHTHPQSQASLIFRPSTSRPKSAHTQPQQPREPRTRDTDNWPLPRWDCSSPADGAEQGRTELTPVLETRRRNSEANGTLWIPFSTGWENPLVAHDYDTKTHGTQNLKNNKKRFVAVQLRFILAPHAQSTTTWARPPC